MFRLRNFCKSTIEPYKCSLLCFNPSNSLDTSIPTLICPASSSSQLSSFPSFPSLLSLLSSLPPPFSLLPSLFPLYASNRVLPSLPPLSVMAKHRGYASDEQESEQDDDSLRFEQEGDREEEEEDEGEFSSKPMSAQER